MTAQDRNTAAINLAVCVAINTITRNVTACGSVRQVQWANTFRVTSDEILLPAFNKSHVSKLQVWNRTGIEIAEVNIEFNRFETEPRADYAKLWMTRRRQERHGCFLSKRRMLNLAMHPSEMPSQLKWLTDMIQEEVVFMRSSDVDPTTIYLTPERIQLLESLQQSPTPEQQPPSTDTVGYLPGSPLPVYSGSLNDAGSAADDDASASPPQAAPRLNRSEPSCATTTPPKKRKTTPSPPPPDTATPPVIDVSACSRLLQWTRLNRFCRDAP
jgi:hypothetical protein